MKRVAVLSAFLMLFPAFLAAEDWSNVSIIDSHCEAKMKTNADAHPRDCALMCAKSGYGIIDQSGNFLKFDAKGSAEAKQLLQNSTRKDHLRVDVTGTRDGNTIHVTSIKMV
jgi:hypothetical protein